MRRKEREVTDPDKIEQIVAACGCCRLGFCDGARAYVVPLSFGYARRADGGYTFFFHSAREGRKIDLIRRTGWAAFEMDANCRMRPGETACAYSTAFQSVLGGGTVSFVEGAEEKRAALTAIMDHSAGTGPWTFGEKSLEAVCVFRLDTEELSCKEHL